MTLSDFSIRRPVFAWMIMAACVIFGSLAFTRLGVSMLPDVTQPILTLNFNYPGAAPDVMEATIISPMEEALSQVQGVTNMESTVMQGVAHIKLTFEWGKDIDAALQETNSRMQSVAMPDQAETPSISKVNTDSQPIIWMGVTWNRPFHELVEYVDLHLKDKFLVVPGVGDIQLGGWSDRALRIWVDNDKLKQYQLTILDIRDTLANDYTEVASGVLENNRTQINIRTLGEERTPADIANMVISSRGGAKIIDSPIRIRDVATVEDGLADIRRFSRADGLASVGMGIRKQQGYNDVQIAENVEKLAAELNKTLPPGMVIATRFNGTTFTKAAINETEFTFIISILVTALVCWAFLGSWSSTLNILFSIPTSILGALIVIYFCGFTLNFFTLLGLSLAIGIVVDDAIMVLENIVRHFRMGKSRVQAASDGAREITFAAIAATLSVVAIFAPVFFVGGMVGVFLFQFGVAISAAVLISLLEAITLTPMRCSQFMEVSSEENPVTRWVGRQFGWLGELYAQTLKICLNHRWKVLLVSGALFLVSLLIVPLLRKELSPPQDTGAIMIRIEARPEASLIRTSDLLVPVENYLKSLPYVQKTFVNVGGFGGGEVATGNIFVTLLPRKDRKLSQQQIVEIIRAHFDEVNGIPKASGKSAGGSTHGPVPGVGWGSGGSKPDQAASAAVAKPGEPVSRTPSGTGAANRPHRRRGPGGYGKMGLKIQVIDLSMGAFSSKRGTVIELSLRGPDYKVLKDKSDEIIKQMTAIGDYTDLDVDYVDGARELHIYPDREKAAISGVTIQTIADTLNAAIGGIRVGEFTNGDRRYDARVRLDADQWETPDDVQNLEVRTQYGELIPITDVTRMEEVTNVQSVTRENRQRVITLFANIKPGVSADNALQKAVDISHQVLPEGYDVRLTGSSQSDRDTFGGIYFILIMGFVVAYMVLATQFNSFIHPISVMTAIPFTFTGAFLSLYLSQNSLNLYSAIGIILLMGVAKKNSILLVEFFNKLRFGKGLSIQDAILQGGPVRLRPIFMTTLATIAAALPSAIGLGPGSEVRAPLAIVVIGGVIVSTVFTLLVVPCFYSLSTRFESKRGRQQSIRAYEEESLHAAETDLAEVGRPA